MTLFLWGLGGIVASGIVAITARRPMLARLLYLAFMLGGCAAVAVAGLRTLLFDTPASVTIHALLPGGDWRIGIDALSGVFLFAIAFVGAACAVFGTYDLARESRSSRFAQLAFAVLIASIVVVVVARAVVVFLGAWELVAISSYVLIVTHHEDRGVRRAGLLYLVATHTATLALFAMFAIWSASATDWSFGALAIATQSLPPRGVTAILLLALFGFGFKAGLVPLHFWLPPAHAAAPSHVSALMSAIVIKTGIYGLLRVLVLLGGAPAWFGWLVFGIGTASAVLGVLWALAQHDTKRLLAYHSVENIGIILMGIGIGVLGVSRSDAAIAMLGFAGGLLHTVNHALFKSLLFLGAGAVYRATGTRNIEDLGGLARRMPLTWIGFGVGAAAIVGLPPLNGFVSEWLVYQGMFRGADAGSLRMALLGIPALALVGALALACFAKISGIVFLGTPRTAAAAGATEARGAYMPALVLAAACVVIGLVPAVGVSLVVSPARDLTGLGDGMIPAEVTSGAWAISLLGLAVMLTAGGLWWLRAAFVRGAGVRREPTWACGYDATSPRLQYTASSFAAPLLAVFGRSTGVHATRTTSAFHSHVIDVVLDGVVLPVWGGMYRVALRFRATHAGRLHIYLLYVMAAVLAMLIWLTVGPR